MSKKYTFWVTLRPQSDCCCQGEADIDILDSKTKWSEFQSASQTAAMRGKAELHINKLAKTSPPQSQSQGLLTKLCYPLFAIFLPPTHLGLHFSNDFTNILPY